MSRLLTVAIPTYNRAAQLDRQLGWLHRGLTGLEDACDIIVSDNASTDATAEVCRRWQSQFQDRGIKFLVNRHDRNIGPLPNISRCFELATGRFVWVIGDDDEIPQGELAWVIQCLRARGGLASIVLNFKGIGRTVFERSYRLDADLYGNGRAVMERLLDENHNGLGFMTAQVYRSEFAREALRAWPEGRTNYDYQIFVSAFVGLRGPVLVTKDTHLAYESGNSIYEVNKRVGLIISVDTLDVLRNLRRVGFSGTLCRRLAWRHAWGIKRRFLNCALRASPLVTAAMLARGAMCLLTLTFLDGGSVMTPDVNLTGHCRS
jgi:glycosyltransferase involved in cell wall biosynthesis